jgi:hypothetical protein
MVTIVHSTVLSLSALVVAASAASAQGPVTWRALDSARAGETVVRIEVSSARRIRIVTTGNGEPLATSDLNPVALRHWAQSVQVGLLLGSPTPFEFENSIAFQSAVKGSDSTGYVMTLADSVGTSRAFYSTGSEAGAIVAALTHAAERVATLSDTQLAEVGPLPTDSAQVRCDRIRDSVLVETPPSRWPLAKPASGSPSRKPPTPSDAIAGVPVTATIVVLSDGSLDPTFFQVTGSSDSQFKTSVFDFFSRLKWIPAEVTGCPVVSRASLMITNLGITRPKR